jgi:hypothetical protein
MKANVDVSSSTPSRPPTSFFLALWSSISLPSLLPFETHTLFEPHTTKKKKRRVYLFVIVFTPDIVDGCEPHLHSASSRTLTSYIYTLGFLIVLTTSWIASNGVALGVRRERERDG